MNFTTRKHRMKPEKDFNETEFETATQKDFSETEFELTKKTRFEHLKAHILPRSVASDFNTAKLEWGLHKISITKEYGKCPCTKSIKEHCYIKNKRNGNVTHVGNICVKRFMEINASTLFSGMKRIQSDPNTKPNSELIKYARRNGHLYGNNEYQFLEIINNKSVNSLSDKQKFWLIKINRRIILDIVVQSLPDQIN